MNEWPYPLSLREAHRVREASQITLERVTAETIVADKVQQRRARHAEILLEKSATSALTLLCIACPEEVATLRLVVQLMQRFGLNAFLQDAEEVLSELYRPSSITDPRR